MMSTVDFTSDYAKIQAPTLVKAPCTMRCAHGMAER